MNNSGSYKNLKGSDKEIFSEKLYSTSTVVERKISKKTDMSSRKGDQKDALNEAIFGLPPKGIENNKSEQILRLQRPIKNVIIFFTSSSSKI